MVSLLRYFDETRTWSVVDLGQVTGVLPLVNGGTGNTIGQINVATQVTGILPVLNGGTGDTGAAWAAYTPAVTAGSGTFTTVSATGRYKQLGKTVFVQIKVIDTTNGSAAGFVIAALPVVPVLNNSFALCGFYQSGVMVAGNISTAGGGVANIFKYDGTFPMSGGGDTLWVSGVYESS